MIRNSPKLQPGCESLASRIQSNAVPLRTSTTKVRHLQPAATCPVFSQLPSSTGRFFLLRYEVEVVCKLQVVSSAGNCGRAFRPASSRSDDIFFCERYYHSGGRSTIEMLKRLTLLVPEGLHYWSCKREAPATDSTSSTRARVQLLFLFFSSRSF